MCEVFMYEGGDMEEKSKFGSLAKEIEDDSVSWLTIAKVSMVEAVSVCECECVCVLVLMCVFVCRV